MCSAFAIAPVPVEIEARNLFWAGYPLSRISELLPVKYNTLISWKNREKWDDAPVIKRIEGATHSRYIKLVNKEEKTEGDYKEINVLGKELERHAKISKYNGSGNGADLNPKLSKRRKGKKQDPAKKNFLDDEQIATLEAAYFDGMFPHQKVWHEAGLTYAIRNILKSRQIGATLHFAREAFIKAIKTGRNQIFISASRSQAYVFKRYIVNFVREHTGVELKGDPIILPNGAELHFLGTNKNTAQSYSGDLYIDECFWMPQFEAIEHVASGMTVLDDCSITYFSTPSSIDHKAYKLWCGDHFNEGRPKKEHIHLDVSHKALRNGRLCEDGHWRQIVTIEDAINSGYSLVTMAKLRLKFPPVKFDNLLMCKFIDGVNSVFSLTMLQRCMIDSWQCWSDFKRTLMRPFGMQRVWVGYDPSRTRDDACLVVIAPPNIAGGKYRLLEKITMQDKDFEHQAKVIKAITERYNVEYIGLDASGMGMGVYELVKKFYPAVTKIVYSVETKNRLVMKTLQLVSRGRFEYDAGDKDLSLAFMTVHRSSTPGGRQITYQSTRTEATGHADEAWAVMHALDNAPLGFSDETDNSNESMMELF